VEHREHLDQDRKGLRGSDLALRRDLRRPDHRDAAVDDPARLDLREPQPWQYMTPAELYAYIGTMQKDR